MRDVIVERSSERTFVTKGEVIWYSIFVEIWYFRGAVRRTSSIAKQEQCRCFRTIFSILPWKALGLGSGSRRAWREQRTKAMPQVEIHVPVTNNLA